MFFQINTHICTHTIVTESYTKSQKIVSLTKCPSPNELSWPDDIGSKQVLVMCPPTWPRSQVREILSEICGMESS